MKCYPMLVASDVAASSLWYQSLLGLQSGHGGDEFEMLMDGRDIAILLHARDVDEHPALEIPEGATPGAGVLLYFSVDDIHAVHARAMTMKAAVIDEPHMNPKAHATEFSLRDPDGYALTVSQRAG